ncbi:hypothetical protein Tco_0110409 [Tanacetum coccineum]
MSDNIPFEIQAEIIKRLLTKPFIQCKSPSKSWKSLIESPEFIADYNNCQAKRQRLLVRWYDVEQYTHVPDPNYISILDDDTFPKHRFATTFPSDMPYCLVDRLKLVGSSQGLLCLFGFGVCPHISDPMLVKFDDVPEPWNVFVFMLSSGAHQDCRSVSISKLKEYLVVLEYNNKGEKHVCAVCAMKHGLPNLFTKLFTINTPASIINKVHELTQNGEPIMERKVHEDGEPAALVVYEQSSDCVKDLGIYGESGSFFVSSSETLLLLDHLD